MDAHAVRRSLSFARCPDPDPARDRYTGGHFEAPRGEFEACGRFARRADGVGCQGATTQYADDGVCVRRNVVACSSRIQRLEQQAARLTSSP